MTKPSFREYTIQDLRDFGIGHLTGESCAIGLRILYDLTPEGVRHIENAFCISLGDNSPPNWNSRVGNIPAIKSIKMSHDQAYHVLVCILASIHDAVVEFTPVDRNNRSMNRILMAGNIAGHREYCDQYVYDGSFAWDNYHIRTYCKLSRDIQPHTGLDNYHGFSSRTR